MSQVLLKSCVMIRRILSEKLECCDISYDSKMNKTKGSRNFGRKVENKGPLHCKGKKLSKESTQVEMRQSKGKGLQNQTK